MSELITTYEDSFPARCRTCPALLAFLHQAKVSEEAATTKTEEMEGMIRGQSVTPSPIDRDILKVKGMFLNVITEVEMQCTKAVARLAEGAEHCPGDPNADELNAFPLSLNIIDSIKQGLVCQNPKLEEAVAEIDYEPR